MVSFVLRADDVLSNRELFHMSTSNRGSFKDSEIVVLAPNLSSCANKDSYASTKVGHVVSLTIESLGVH